MSSLIFFQWKYLLIIFSIIGFSSSLIYAATFTDTTVIPTTSTVTQITSTVNPKTALEISTVIPTTSTATTTSSGLLPTLNTLLPNSATVTPQASTLLGVAINVAQTPFTTTVVTPVVQTLVGVPDVTDSDGDGIADNIDDDPNDLAIDSFSDGITFGTILSGNANLSITDDLANGVNIVATGPATVSVCGTTALSLIAGNSVGVKCGSVTIDVVNGPVNVTFTADDGTILGTTLITNDKVTFESDTVTLTNDGPNTVEVFVNGQPVPPIDPGQSFTPDTTPPEITIISTVDGFGNVIVDGGSTFSPDLFISFVVSDNAGAVTTLCLVIGQAVPCISPSSFGVDALGGFIDENYVWELRATDTSGNENNAFFFWTWISSEEALEDTSDDIEDIIAANPDTSLADKLEDANAKVKTAQLELDKTPPDNQAAAGNIEGAIGDIEAAAKDGLLDPAQGSQLMDDLAGIARQLASDAIDAATAGGGDPVKILDSEQSLSDGDSLRALGQFKDAVNKYKDALAKAESALA